MSWSQKYATWFDGNENVHPVEGRSQIHPKYGSEKIMQQTDAFCPNVTAATPNETR